MSRKDKSNDEGFTFNWKGYKLIYKKRKNNFEVEVIINDMKTSMFRIERKNNVCIPIMKRISNYDYIDRPLFYCRFEKHPLQKLHFFSSITLEFESIEIVLYIGALKRILTYFRVTPTEDKGIQEKVEVEPGKHGIEDMLQ